MTTETFAYQNLIAGDFPRIVESLTLASGQGTVAVGTVLGLVDRAVGTPAADEGNTGNGTIGTVTLGAGAEIGVYTATLITAASNAGTFSVFAPSGARLADARVGVAYVGPVNFTIADSTEDFIAGDIFTIPVVAPGTIKAKVCNSANVDGSQRPYGVLAEAVDTTADAVSVAYLSGEFNAAALVFGGSDTYATHKAALRDLNIYVKTAVPA